MSIAAVKQAMEQAQAASGFLRGKEQTLGPPSATGTLYEREYEVVTVPVAEWTRLAFAIDALSPERES